jgi:hypothetical protein
MPTHKLETSLKKLLAITMAFGAMALAPAMAATSVGVSIDIAQPGVYGRIDIGNYPQPRVVYAQPIVIARPVYRVEQQPVYLYVPPGHQKKWSKFCGRYNACGQPVYFVQEEWVRERYDDRRGRDDYRGDDHDHGRGHGNGRGHGGRDRGDHDR